MQQSLRSINEAIRAPVAEFIGSLADNFTQVIKDRLSGFTKRFSEEIVRIMRQSCKPLTLLIRGRSEVLVVKEKGIISSSGSRPALVLGNFEELTR